MLDASSPSQLPASPSFWVEPWQRRPRPRTATPAPSYFVGEVQNNQVTITYTVYNEQADTETGVLLTTTLQAGRDPAQFDGDARRQHDHAASRPERPEPGLEPAADPGIRPRERRGHRQPAKLRPPFSSTPAPTLTPCSTPAPCRQPRPPRRCRPATSADPALLASTPDANTTDPYVQEEAAKLNYDPTQIFNFLHTAHRLQLLHRLGARRPRHALVAAPATPWTSPAWAWP